MSRWNDSCGGRGRWLVALAAFPTLMTALATPATADPYPGGGSNPPGHGPPQVLGEGISRPSGGTSGAGGGALAFTGASILLLLLVAAVCIGFGLWVRRAARRAQ